MNSNPESLRRVEQITGKSVDFREVDLLDAAAVDSVFAEGGFEAVVHFAGLKAVGESVEKPLMYYQNNVVGTLNLLHSMDAAGVRRLVFSSSATVYGASEEFPSSRRRRWMPPTPMAAPRNRSRTSSPTWGTPIPAGASPCCATSTRWAPTVWPDWRGPERHPQQSAAVRGPGGRGTPRKSDGVRQRLPNAGRHRGAGLHPRDGPRRRPLGRQSTTDLRPLHW